jgi:hypothetical protein
VKVPLNSVPLACSARYPGWTPSRSFAAWSASSGVVTRAKVPDVVSRLVITSEETEREKARLPRGWGRFGKAIDGLVAVSEPDEVLLSCCIGVHPSVKRHFTAAGGLYELTKSTNVLLGATDRRVIVMATGAGGGPRDHASIPRDGLEVADVSKRELTLRWPETSCTSRESRSRCRPASSTL